MLCGTSYAACGGSLDDPVRETVPRAGMSISEADARAKPTWGEFMLLPARRKGPTRSPMEVALHKSLRPTLGPHDHHLWYTIDPAGVLTQRQSATKTRVVLFFHGNGVDVPNMHDSLVHVARTLNSAIIALEYPGYGALKAFEATEAATLHAAEAFYVAMSRQFSNADHTELILMGQSVGTGVACHLAAHASEPSRQRIMRLPSHVILISPFVSFQNVLREFIGWGSIAFKERFPNVHNLVQSDPQIPVFIVHGDLDQVIPIAHSDTLARERAKVARGGCWTNFLTVRGMDHTVPLNYLAAHMNTWFDAVEAVRKDFQKS